MTHTMTDKTTPPADCSSGSSFHPVDGLHTWSNHALDCEQEDGPRPCGVAAFEAEEREEQMVADFRASLRADRLIVESDHRDGEWTAACVGCLNGCSYCEG